MAKKKTARRTPAKVPAAIDRGIACVHCDSVNYKWDGRVVNTYPNGNRRIKCAACGRPFIIRRDRDGSL